MPITSSQQPRSNIRASVQWKDSSIFAGEEIECIITFRNIAVPVEQQQDLNAFFHALPTPQPQQRDSRHVPFSPISPSVSSTAPQSRPGHSRTPSTVSVQAAQPIRGHRPTLSLNLARSSSRAGSSNGVLQNKVNIPVGKGHGRSLSIMSLATDSTTDKRGPTTLAAARKPSARGHSRSASLQVGSRSSLQTTQSLSSLPTRRHSPLHESITPTTADTKAAESKLEQLSVRPVRRKGTVSAGNTPQLAQEGFEEKSPGEAMPDFEFPPRKTSLAGTPLSPTKPIALAGSPVSPTKQVRTPSTMHSGQPRPVPLRATESSANTNPAHVNPITRVLSESSTSGTPRSSIDFYSLSNSNHSDETLTSEVPSQTTADPTTPITPKVTKHSRKQVPLGPARPETLMIGYVRTNGFFTLDGSLVNSAPFEDVKRKVVQGGGGVVGVERPKRSSGVFGAFGWGNIGESIGGLLGGNEMSTIAQMKASAGSKSIPLLSTPQTLMFVDVTLSPGESKSYVYRFPLPKGLPPSHRGRAMKVEYNLSIGVQRLENQTVQYVDVPFRVLGSVNTRGEALGHDLLTPYVLLQDSGHVDSTATPSSSLAMPLTFPEAEKKNQPQQKELESFLRYTERLLHNAKETNGALLSPTEALSPSTTPRKSSLFDTTPANAKEAIDMALMNANIVQNREEQDDVQSANRYSIARSGQPVAVLTLLRPAYRLGEVITGSVDFTIPPQSDAVPVQCQSVHIELQSAETVDAALALRSAASIQRVTKKIHASSRENVLFSRKLGFTLAIPANATPSFETTGVSLAWTLRIEFTTVKQTTTANGKAETDDNLLEELNRDERGITLIAREKLAAEMFEVAIPLKVYGAYSIVVASDKEPELLEIS